MWLRRIVSLLAAVILSGIPVAAQSLPSASEERSIPILSRHQQRPVDSLAPDAVSFADILNGDGSIYTLHRIMGYTTMAGVLATGLLGWLAPGDLHGAVAMGTTGLAAATTGIGIYNYARGGAIPLPHIILTGLGTMGFAANLFIEAEDSDEGGSANLHPILGTASVGAFALGVSWVIFY